MSGFYTGLQSTVSKLIADKGQLVTLRRVDPSGSYDVATGTQVQAAAVLYSAAAVVLDYPNREIDGTQIMRGDRKVLVPVSSTMAEPQVGDSVDVGGSLYSVVSVQVLQPGGTAVLYTLQVRAGG